MTRPMTKTVNVPVADGEGERYSLRMGPQHPATHGVLRVDLELDGEKYLIRDKHIYYKTEQLQIETELEEYKVIYGNLHLNKKKIINKKYLYKKLLDQNTC